MPICWNLPSDFAASIVIRWWPSQCHCAVCHIMNIRSPGCRWRGNLQCSCLAWLTFASFVNRNHSEGCLRLWLEILYDVVKWCDRMWSDFTPFCGEFISLFNLVALDWSTSVVKWRKPFEVNGGWGDQFDGWCIRCSWNIWKVIDWNIFNQIINIINQFLKRSGQNFTLTDWMIL